jgi:hypothetical protein
MTQRLLVLTAAPDQDLTDRIPDGWIIEKIAVCPSQLGSGQVTIALVLTEQSDDPNSGKTWGRRYTEG